MKHTTSFAISHRRRLINDYISTCSILTSKCSARFPSGVDAQPQGDVERNNPDEFHKIRHPRGGASFIFQHNKKVKEKLMHPDETLMGMQVAARRGLSFISRHD